jgi:hypothetical protein
MLHVVEDPDVGQDDEPGGVDVEQQHVLTGAARYSKPTITAYLRPDQLRGELLELARAGRGDQRGGAVEDPADGVVEPGGPFLRAEGVLEHGERRRRPCDELPYRPRRSGARCPLGRLLRFATTRYRRHARDLDQRSAAPTRSAPNRADAYAARRRPAEEIAPARFFSSRKDRIGAPGEARTASIPADAGAELTISAAERVTRRRRR